MVSTPWSKLDFPSRLERVSPLLDDIVADARDAGFDERERFGIRLALDEAVTNAVKHGNELDPRKTVYVAWRTEPGLLEVTVRDEGPGFDPLEVPDPTAPENLTKPSGRGVMLMKNYMDEVFFSETGNQVTLKKNQAVKAESS